MVDRRFMRGGENKNKATDEDEKEISLMWGIFDGNRQLFAGICLFVVEFNLFAL